MAAERKMVMTNGLLHDSLNLVNQHVLFYINLRIVFFRCTLNVNSLVEIIENARYGRYAQTICKFISGI